MCIVWIIKCFSHHWCTVQNMKILCLHLLNPFLIGLVCCSCWPPQPCSVTQTCIPPHLLLKLPHTAMNVKFCHSQAVSNGTMFEPHVPHVFTAFHFDWHWTGVMDSCGFKVTCDGGEISRECMETVLSTFHYGNNKYDRGGGTFKPYLVGLQNLMRFNSLFSQKRATCDRTAGRQQPVFLPSTFKNLRILSSVSEACLMMVPCSTRASHRCGCNEQAHCRHGRCPPPLSGIVRCAVVAQGMAAMAQDAAVKSRVHHCVHSTN